MNETHHTPSGQPSAFDELRAKLDLADEGFILESLPRPKRGPLGHPRRPLWRAHLYGYLTGAKHTNAVIRQLRKHPALRELCGFTDALPDRRTFNRFNAKIAASTVEFETFCVTLDIKKSGALPGFGERLAIDSTNVPTHSSARKKVRTDPDAGWTAKSVPNPRPDEPKDKDWHFGYKYHAIADATYGIPMYGFTTPANQHDSPTLTALLEEVSKEFGAPKAVIADKGYDSQKNHDAIRAVGAEPIIDLIRSRRKDAAGDLHTADGILKCVGGQPMERIAHDPAKGWLYRCRREGCDLKDRKAGVRYCDTVVWDKLPVSRRYPRLPRSSAEWKRLYRMRQSVERLFKTLKESRRLASHCSRGLDKVSLHVAMSVLAFQVTALYWIRTGRTHLLRWMVEPVP